MARARVRLSEGLSELLRSDWEEIIREANLGEENTFIAQRYLLDAIPQVDIAEELGDCFNKSYDRSTISRRLPSIIKKIEKTAKKLNKLT
jgi:hypothetical protein